MVEMPNSGECRVIGFVGAGNVARHLAEAFLDAGLDVPVMVNRHSSRRERLPDRLRGRLSQDMDDLVKQGVDLVVIAVGDSSIEDVARALAGRELRVVHTSGAVSSRMLAAAGPRYGSFYPLQTMTMDEDVDLEQVPICICANSQDFSDQLVRLAGKITARVHAMEDGKRQWLHLAAVMMNNNINHVLSRVRDLIEAKDLPPGALDPLLQETVRKAVTCDPRKIQTGPARRNDGNTRVIHEEMLGVLEKEDVSTEGLSAQYAYFWQAIQDYYGRDICPEG
jgi:predicted short-subunit dehydrogenase-like oxidoreductase (DUF2520 family)